jgi:hypothetical protein
MSTGKRLTYYVEKQGFKKKEFCLKFSFEYNNLVNVMADKRTLGINILNQLHFALPKLNIHWLLYGEGPEELDEKQSNILNEPAEMYVKNNDAFEFMLLKYLENDKIKKKIYEIIQQKTN